MGRTVTRFLRLRICSSALSAQDDQVLRYIRGGLGHVERTVCMSASGMRGLPSTVEMGRGVALVSADLMRDSGSSSDTKRPWKPQSGSMACVSECKTLRASIRYKPAR